MESNYNEFILPALMLFCTGLVGALIKKNLVIIFMCIEMMLCASLLLGASFASQYASNDALVLGFFVIAIAACEIAVALAVIIQHYKLKACTNINCLDSERE